MMYVILALIAVLCLMYYLFPIIQVVGDSMHPTYRDGEIIVGRRIYRKSKLKVGDVVIFKSPTEEDRIVIKRVSDIISDNKRPRFIYFLGDNPDCSYDSRDYGYVSSSNLVCRVIKQRRK